MSNLWRHDRADDAAAFGSFAIGRTGTPFAPWNWQQDEHVEPAPEAEPLEDDVAVAIQTDAFAQGFDAGRRTVELEVAAERDAIAHLAESLKVLRPEPTNALAALLAETVERLVRQVVGNVEVDPALLIERARHAAAMVGEEMEPARMRLHPDDLRLMEPARIPVALVADPSLARGSIILQTSEGWIEDGPAVRLDLLRAALDQMDMPQ